MDNQCKSTISHINRIQGQLTALKKYIEENNDCDKVVQLAVSISKSFDSLKGKLAEGYIEREILDSKKISPKKKKGIEALLRLIKK